MCFSVCMDVTVLYVKCELYLSVCVGREGEGAGPGRRVRLVGWGGGGG